MDIYSSKTPNPYKLIKGGFIMLAIATLLGVVLFFTLSLYETAQASNGEIIAQNAAVQYLAPYEAEVLKVAVHNGAKVQKGDTLIVLYNEQVLAAYEETINSQALAAENITIYDKQLNNLKRKISRQKKEISLLKQNLKSKKKGKSHEVESLQRQLAVLEKKMRVSNVRIKNDDLLLKKGAMSQREYDSKYKTYLDEVNNLNEVKNKLYQEQNLTENIDGTYQEGYNKNQLTILNQEQDYLELEKRRSEEIALQKQLEAKVKSQQKEVDKLTIIADMDGYTNNIFNTKKEVNFVAKSLPLLHLSPLSEEKFYATLQVNEQEIKDVQIGQPVHMKVTAYNHYQHGVLKGKVSSIDKTDLNIFYVLADISEQEAAKMKLKSGYKVKGEVILNELKLYQYVFNSMFKKM